MSLVGIVSFSLVSLIRQWRKLRTLLVFTFSKSNRFVFVKGAKIESS